MPLTGVDRAVIDQDYGAAHAEIMQTNKKKWENGNSLAA